MSERSQVLALLDELHATESAGAAAMERWLDVAVDPTLRGGLRVIAARDAAHGALALDRLRALGGAPERRPTPAMLELLRLVESPDVSDAAKLRAMAARLPSDQGDRIRVSATGISEDLETRALVETMSDDDRVSLAWLRAMVERVRPASDGVETASGAGPTGAALASFAAAEAASARVFEAWCDVCESPGLRGGLRTIATREATHARLLAARAGELGTPTDGAVRDVERALARWGSSQWPDGRKLDALLAHRAASEAAGDPVLAMTRTADAETRTMVRLVA